jgi:hypothetical protein
MNDLDLSLRLAPLRRLVDHLTEERVKVRTHLHAAQQTGTYDRGYWQGADNYTTYAIDQLEAALLALPADCPPLDRAAQAGQRHRNHPYIYEVYLGSACQRCGLEMNHHLHCGPFGPGITRQVALADLPPPEAPPQKVEEEDVSRVDHRD